MKRLTYILSVLVLAAACAKEPAAPEKERVSVLFEVSAGEQTRAIGDASGVDLLYGAVFNADATEEYTSLRFSGNSFNPSLDLLSGETYTVVFWAQSSEGTVYSISDGDLSAISIDYSSAVACDETMDAFYGKATFTASRGKSVSLTLQRTVSQINFLSTTPPSLQIEQKASVSVTGGLAGSFNAVDGTASAPVADPVTFSEALVPGDEVSLSGDNIQDQNYYRAAYVYAVPVEGAVAQSVELTIYEFDEPGNVFTVADVPLESNYRSNITGEIFN